MKSQDKIKEFEGVYRTYFRQIQSFCQYYLQDTDAAENAAQDVFLILWRRSDKVDFDDNIKSYLFVLAKNLCLNVLKRSQTHLKYIESVIASKQILLNEASLQHPSIDHLYEQEIQYILDSTLNGMPERTKRIFQLSREEYFSYKEIAEKEQVTTKTVEYHISSALRLLRTALKGYIAF